MDNLKKNWRFIIIIILYSSKFFIQMYHSSLQILIQCYNHPPTKQVSILVLQKFKAGYQKVKSCEELRGLLLCTIRLMLGTLFFSTSYFKLHLKSDFLSWTENPGTSNTECVGYISDWLTVMLKALRIRSV